MTTVVVCKNEMNYIKIAISKMQKNGQKLKRFSGSRKFIQMFL